MNITTHLPSTENGNIHLNENLSGQQPVNATGKELVLYYAAKGTIFQGDILDVRGNQVSIQSGNNILSALLENGMNVNIGDHLSFLVKENDGTKILLKPVMEEETNIQNVLVKTLEEASLPVTERNLSAVKEMMSHGMPVDRNSMMETGKLLTQFQSANVETIVGLKSHGLPVTETNITMFETYQRAEGKISDNLNSIVSELNQMAEQAIQTKNFGNVEELLTKVNQIFSEDIENKILENESVPKVNSSSDGNLTIKATPEILQESPEVHIRTLVKNIEANIMKNLMITPEQLTENGEKSIKELYHKLYETTDKLSEIVSSSGNGESKLMSTAGDLKNNLSFMQDFNQLSAYVQLPVQINGKEHNSELYVLSRKRKKYSPDEALTAFLHLDMEHLGATDVRVSLLNGKINTKFTLDNDDSMKLIEEHLDELKKRLETLGYSVEISAETEKIEKNKTAFEKVLEADRPKHDVKRFSFDVRA
ncbi:MAG: flagellar hook-length control protein FliK [Lachnospiraceae bacterium]|nr:flagellar hook-length control protein FliK [Lachnospiraceae bacterium]